MSQRAVATLRCGRGVLHLYDVESMQFVAHQMMVRGLLEQAAHDATTATGNKRQKTLPRGKGKERKSEEKQTAAAMLSHCGGPLELLTPALDIEDDTEMGDPAPHSSPIAKGPSFRSSPASCPPCSPAAAPPPGGWESARDRSASPGVDFNDGNTDDETGFEKKPGNKNSDQTAVATLEPAVPEISMADFESWASSPCSSPRAVMSQPVATQTEASADGMSAIFLNNQSEVANAFREGLGGRPDIFVPLKLYSEAMVWADVVDSKVKEYTNMNEELKGQVEALYKDNMNLKELNKRLLAREP